MQGHIYSPIHGTSIVTISFLFDRLFYRCGGGTYLITLALFFRLRLRRPVMLYFYTICFAVEYLMSSCMAAYFTVWCYSCTISISLYFSCTEMNL